MSTCSSSSARPLKIGIIGFGNFAQFLSKTMIKQGHSLRATSRSDHSQLCKQLGIPFYRDMSAFLESDNEVVLICTSILSLSQVVKPMPFNSLKRPTLFVDVLSVKEFPRDLLLQVLPENMDLLCTHPMFGPESGKHGWQDLSFMYDRVRIRDEALCYSFIHIFSSEGCRMLEMSCEEHDKLAARTQFLTHTIGRILSEMDVEPTPLDTKGFQKLFEVVGHYKTFSHGEEKLVYALYIYLNYLQKESTVKDSFDLFSGLFIHNRFARQQMQSLEEALEKTKRKLQERMESST